MRSFSAEGGYDARGKIRKSKGHYYFGMYRELLRATTVDTVENVAAIAGIDLTRPDFWRESLKTITDQIDMFIAETSK